MEFSRETPYNVHEHNHTEWTDEQLDIEAAQCEMLLDKWQVNEERRRQIGQRALLVREETIHRYGERHNDSITTPDLLRRML